MPRLHPAHEVYWPKEPSPLSLYYYTAADIEREANNTTLATQAAETGEGGADLDSGISTPTPTIPETDASEGEDIGESPRKRRRIAVGEGDGVALETEDARRGSGCLMGSAEETLPATSPAEVGEGATTWSFRALEEDAVAGVVGAGLEERPRASDVKEAATEESESASTSDPPHDASVDPQLVSASRSGSDETTPRPVQPSSSIDALQDPSELTAESQARPHEEDQDLPDLEPVDEHESATERQHSDESSSSSSSSPSTTLDLATGDTAESKKGHASIQHLIISDDERSTGGLDTPQGHQVPQATPGEGAANDVPQPDSPDEVPARSTFPLEGTGRLVGLVKVGSSWS